MARVKSGTIEHVLPVTLGRQLPCKEPVSPFKGCISQDLEVGTKLVNLCTPTQTDAEACEICMETDTETLAMECCGNGINCEKKYWCFSCIEKQTAVSKSIPRCPFCRAMLPVSLVWALMSQRYMAQRKREKSERPPEAPVDAGGSGLRGLFAGLAMFTVVMFLFVMVIYVAVRVFHLD